MSRWPAMGLIAVVAAGGALLCWLYVAEVAKNLETSKAAAGVGSGQVRSLLQNDRGEAGKPATDLSPVIAALTQSVRELAAGLEQVKQGLQEERGRSGKEVDQLTADLAQVQQSAQRESEQARRLTEELAADIGQMRLALQQQGDRAEKLVLESPLRLPKRDLAALEQEGERIGRLNLVTSDVAQLKQALGSLATDLDKVRQVLLQESEKSERNVTQLATELMAAKQSAQRAREEADRRDRELTTSLAQLQEALQLEIYRNEKVAGKSSADVAQINEALRRESEQRIQITAELKAGLAQLKLAVREVTADLAVKQRVQQYGAKGEPLADHRTIDPPTSGETEKLPATRSEATAESDATGFGPLRENVKFLPAPSADHAQTGQTSTGIGDAELQRLMSRASLLLSQGDIGAARTVLERAAETGNARALFALAETFDPVVLSAWGTVGTRGDAARARELYAKALAGGVQEAKSRLTR